MGQWGSQACSSGVFGQENAMVKQNALLAGGWEVTLKAQTPKWEGAGHGTMLDFLPDHCQGKGVNNTACLGLSRPAWGPEQRQARKACRCGGGHKAGRFTV